MTRTNKLGLMFFIFGISLFSSWINALFLEKEAILMGLMYFLLGLGAWLFVSEK